MLAHGKRFSLVIPSSVTFRRTYRVYSNISPGIKQDHLLFFSFLNHHTHSKYRAANRISSGEESAQYCMMYVLYSSSSAVEESFGKQFSRGEGQVVQGRMNSK